jgi:flavin-dependent dehydrogenase
MPERSRRPRVTPADAALTFAAAVIGAAIAGAYAAYRAVSLESAAAPERWERFADTMLWPGALIFAAVAAMVWFGWKLNID